jgi:hypothetical protein
MAPVLAPLRLVDAPPVPHGRTARRLQWQHLPPPVRAAVEAQLGTPVAQERSQGSGFTPGFASVLTGADGTRHFVKAASRVAQRQVADSYAEEARKLRLLPAGLLPLPRLVWRLETAGWLVLGLQHVEARPPERAWRTDDLRRCLSVLEQVAEVMDEATLRATGLDLAPLHEDLPTLVSGWRTVGEVMPDWPHLAELGELAAAYADLPDAGRFVHADARDDNFLLADDGATLLCDWSWPALGPAWLDAVTLLVSAHGDGLDADAALARSPLTRDVPGDHVDAWLAALCGFMVEADEHPVPASSPFLGVHRRWWAAATWSWLARRRGWDGPTGG